MINQIVEKYLSSYKNYGKVVDIWVNPSKKEMKEAATTGMLRFIADSRTETIYFSDAYTSMHVNMWNQIKKETGQRTPSSPYNGVLMIGEMMPDTGYVYLDSMGLFGGEEFKEWEKKDWLWTKKYLPHVKSEMKRYKKERG